MLKFELTERERFVVARLEGLVSLEGWAAVLEDLANSLHAIAGPPRLIIDLNALLGYLGVPERQMVGALMARHFTKMQKVAVVVPEHKITNVVRDEAQRNGLDLQLFPRFEDAEVWVGA